MREIPLPTGVSYTALSLGIEYPKQNDTDSPYTLRTSTHSKNVGRWHGTVRFQRLESGRDDDKIIALRRFLFELEGQTNYWEQPIEFALAPSSIARTFTYEANMVEVSSNKTFVPVSASGEVSGDSGIVANNTFIRDMRNNKTSLIVEDAAATGTGTGFRRRWRLRPEIKTLQDGEAVVFTDTIRARLKPVSKDFILNIVPSGSLNIDLQWREAL